MNFKIGSFEINNKCFYLKCNQNRLESSERRPVPQPDDFCHRDFSADLEMSFHDALYCFFAVVLKKRKQQSVLYRMSLYLSVYQFSSDFVTLYISLYITKSLETAAKVKDSYKFSFAINSCAYLIDMYDFLN